MAEAVGGVVLFATEKLAVAVQPLPFMTVTEYGPEAKLLMSSVVAPLDQSNVLPPGGVTVRLIAPLDAIQEFTAVIEPERVMLLFVTTKLLVEVQPLVAVAMTEYVPGLLMVMDGVVCPLFHKKVVKSPGFVTSTVPFCPAQRAGGPVKMGVSPPLARTISSDLVQLIPSTVVVTFTVYVPGPVTVIEGVVC